MNVVVVGGGIIGSAVAFRLTEAGAKVTLLDAGPLGGGTSAVGYAWLNASAKPPFEYHALNVSGIAEYQTLRTELGHAPWLHMDGHVAWDTTEGGPQRFREKVERLRSWGYQAELLPVSELASIEPDLVPPTELEEFAYFPTEGYLDPVLCIGSLAGAARDRGATIRTHTQVTGFLQDESRVRGVRTASGEEIPADVVVTCTGRWTDEVARLAGINVPMNPNVGLTAFSAPTAARLRSLHHSNDVNIRPDGAGRILMRHRDFDARVSIDSPVDPIPAFTQELVDRVAKVLPAISGTRIESIRIALRPIPADGYSVVGPAPGVEGLYVVATHSGVTLGALLGRLVSREVATGYMDPRLANFRPDRFVGEASPA